MPGAEHRAAARTDGEPQVEVKPAPHAPSASRSRSSSRSRCSRASSPPAHRDPAYRRSVNAQLRRGGLGDPASSNVTGPRLAVADGQPGRVQPHAARVPGSKGRTSGPSTRALDAQRLAPPPPDANAYVRIVDTMRLRAAAVDLMRAALEGLLVLHPLDPAGTAGAEPDPVPSRRRAGRVAAAALLGRAARRERTASTAACPWLFASVGPARPCRRARWTSPSTNRLMPTALALEASAVRPGDPTLARDGAPQHRGGPDPAPLAPTRAGLPDPPTLTFLVAVSVRNSGTAPSPVVAVISVRPTGRIGRSASGTRRRGGRRWRCRRPAAARHARRARRALPRDDPDPAAPSPGHDGRAALVEERRGRPERARGVTLRSAAQRDS